MPKNPTPRPLPPNIHRPRQKRHANGNSANDKKHIPNTLGLNPRIRIKRQPEREDVFREIHRRERLACFLAVAVHYVCHDTGGTQLHAQVD